MTDPRPTPSLDKIILRLPDGMRERLNELARVNGRSANAEAVQALQAWLLPDAQVEPAFVRLPDAIWRKVGHAAKRNKRGIVEEIAARLEETLSGTPAEDPSGGALDLRAEIRGAMREAIEGLFGEPEKLRALAERTRRRDGGPVSE